MNAETGNIVTIVAIVVVVILALVGIVFIFLHQRKIHQEKKQEAVVEKKIEKATDELSDEFGGKDNIVSIAQMGSRVTVTLKSTAGITAQSLDAKGLKGALIMSNKVVFPVGPKAKEFADMLIEKTGFGK